METKANYVAVGAFVLGCIIALVVAVLWLAGAQYAQQYAVYQTYFPAPVTGLGRGTTVRYNGIDVGTVRDVNFDPDDPQRVAATLQVDPALRLRSNSIASLESQGLTGATYVEISGGTRDAPFLKAQAGQRYPVIASRQSAIQQLYESTPLLLQNLNMLAERGNDLLNAQNRQALAQTIANLRDLTDTLNAHSSDITDTLAHLDQTTQKLNQTLASADDAAKKIAVLSTHADAVVQRGGIAQIDQLVDQTRALVASMTRLSNELEREPTKLLFGDRREGYAPK